MKNKQIGTLIGRNEKLMYRRFCTKAAACAMSLMMAGGVSVITSENNNIKNVSASSTYYRYVTASSLNVRSGASTRYSRVGSYKKGTKVTCYGTSGSWTKVRYGGKTRYVSSQYLSAKKPGSSTSSSTSTSAYSRYVTASSLNIRSKASTSSSRVGSYKKGTNPVSIYLQRSRDHLQEVQLHPAAKDSRLLTMHSSLLEIHTAMAEQA